MRVAILIGLLLLAAPTRAQVAVPAPVAEADADAEVVADSESGSGSDSASPPLPPTPSPREGEPSSNPEADSESASPPLPPTPSPEGEPNPNPEAASDSNSDSDSDADRPPLAPGVFYAGLALSFVSLAVGGYFGVEALAAHDRERTRDPRLPPDLAGIEESAITADVFFTLGALLAGATVVAAFFTDWPGDDPPETPETPAARVVPLPTGAAIVGRF